MTDEFLRCIQERHTTGSLNPNELDHSGLSLTHQAAKDGQLTCLKWLVKYGGDLNVRSLEDLTPAHYASGEGHLKILQYLHEKQRESISFKSDNSVTPLYLAAQEGQLDCLIWLTKSSAVSPDVQTDEGMTPSHAASQGGHLECLRYLIKAANAQIKMVDYFGCSVLHYAASEGHWKIIKWLINHCSMAVDEKDNGATTPLHVAANGGHENAVHMLITCGAELQSKDNLGKTPLDYAIEKKHRSCIDMIKNMMHRSPEQLRSMKKVRFNESVSTYNISSNRKRFQNRYGERHRSSDYWDEIIQSQFDYWITSPPNTKRRREKREVKTFYKGRSKNLSQTVHSRQTKLRSKDNTSRKAMRHLKEEKLESAHEPPDLLKHLKDNVNNRPQFSGNVSPSRVSEEPVKRSKEIKYTIEDAPDWIASQDLNVKVNNEDIPERIQNEPTGSPIGYSTPAHSLPYPFSNEEKTATRLKQNPIFSVSDSDVYSYPQLASTVSLSPGKLTTEGSSQKIMKNHLTHATHQDQYAGRISSHVHTYTPTSFINKNVLHTELKDFNTYSNSNSIITGRKFNSDISASNTDLLRIPAASNYDSVQSSNTSLSNLKELKMDSYTDQHKAEFFSRYLSQQKRKTSTWRSLRNGMASLFNSIRPRRDQNEKTTWSHARTFKRDDIFKRFNITPKTSKREFDDLFSNSVEGQYTAGKTKNSNMTTSGKFIATPLIEERRMQVASIGASPYDRFSSNDARTILVDHNGYATDVFSPSSELDPSPTKSTGADHNARTSRNDYKSLKR